MKIWPPARAIGTIPAVPAPRVVVLGLGITGSSIAAALARQGWAVTGIEQFAPLHERGSSHGDTRIYRRIPHEGAIYVELAARAWDGWLDWSESAHEDLLVPCGGIDAGPADSPIVMEAEALCRLYGQDHELFGGAAFNRRFPHFSLPSNWKVVYQRSSGIVRPDATRRFLHAMAKAEGAKLMHDTRATLDLSTADVYVEGEPLTSDFLIVAAGSWLSKILPDLPLVPRPERRVMAWYRPIAVENLTDGRLPVFILDADGGWYGMPTPDGAVKIGHDKHLRQLIDPDDPPGPPDAADAARLAGCIASYFTGFSETPSALKPCIYTLADDHHFVIDWHPMHSRILIFSCCSGHGFKYAPEYGAIAADLLGGKSRPDLAPFSFNRLGPAITRFGG